MARRALGARLYFDNGRGVWVIRDTGGVFIRTSYGFAELDAAEKRLAAYIANKIPDRKGGPAQPGDVTVGEVLARYVEDRGTHVKGQATLVANVTRLAEYWGDLTCDAVKGTTCRAYEKARAKPQKGAGRAMRGAGPSTVRRELGVLQAALNHAHVEGLLIHPIRVALSAAGESRTRWLTRDEVARLLRASSPHTRRFILISIYTGRRMSAVLDLTWTRVDLGTGRIHFRAEGERETKKRRGSVVVPRQLLAHLRRWHRMAQETGPYVVGWRGERIDHIKGAMRRARDRAGLDHEVNRHALKHTAITWAMMRGLGVEDAAEFFDTSAATIRAVYWQHSPHHQAAGREAMERRG